LWQVNGVLELNAKPEGTARYSALDKWSGQLAHLQRAIVNKMA
jgi:COP9 signalosome complex subunit 2